MNWGACLILSLALAAKALAADPSAECMSCHDQEGANFKASVHGSAGCTNCHTTIRGYPHPENPPKVKCDTCHAESAAGVAESVHVAASPQPCKGCHGDPHGMLAKGDPKSSVYPLNMPRTCGTCHGDKKLAKKYGLPEVYSMYLDSIHGFALTRDGLLVAATCSSCHGSHKILHSRNPNSRTAHANIPATCGSCHAGVKQAYSAGIHGVLLEAGDDRAPVCTSCHTAHQIADVRTAAWQMKTTATCGKCHQEQFTTYRDTFHAQVSALGYIETAHCWDCHGEHEILPASDAKSTIAPANLVNTCGKCHPGANKSFVTYQPHADRKNRAAFPGLHYSGIFMNLLLSGVLGFFILHTLLWLIRSVHDRRTNRLAPASNLPGER